MRTQITNSERFTHRASALIRFTDNFHLKAGRAHPAHKRVSPLKSQSNTSESAHWELKCNRPLIGRAQLNSLKLLATMVAHIESAVVTHRVRILVYPGSERISRVGTTHRAIQYSTAGLHDINHRNCCYAINSNFGIT